MICQLHLPLFTDEVDIISSSKPYAIAYSPQPSISLPVLLDIDGGDVDKEWIWGWSISTGIKSGKWLKKELLALI